MRLRTGGCIAALLVLALFLIGCDSSAAARRIGEFAAATAELKDATNESFALAEGANSDAYLSHSFREGLRAAGKPAADRDNAVRVAIARFDPAALQPLFSVEDLQARQDVLDGLATYAARLSKIMGNESLDQIDARSKELGTALSKLGTNPELKRVFPGAVSAFDENKVGIFATAVNSLGRWLVDAVRFREVPPVIKSMDADVGRICELIERDIGVRPDNTGKGAAGLRGILWNKSNDMLADERQVIASTLLASVPQAPEQLRGEFEHAQHLWALYNETDAKLAATAKAVRTLRQAHAALDAAFKNDAPELDSLIATLRKEVDRIRGFYRSTLPP